MEIHLLLRPRRIERRNPPQIRQARLQLRAADAPKRAGLCLQVVEGHGPSREASLCTRQNRGAVFLGDGVSLRATQGGVEDCSRQICQNGVAGRRYLRCLRYP
ncbi:unnamed protein product [Linum tenue]|uniref:Uncharacterized protein n=1 Tax=Linum tenue TaxID=586396 RepID=A0AAV0M2C8_9ROSI|nr:unnamed protein product [Linum tenue]